MKLYAPSFNLVKKYFNLVKQMAQNCTFNDFLTISLTNNDVKTLAIVIDDFSSKWHIWGDPRGVHEQAQGFQDTKRRFLQTGWFLWYKYFELFNIGLYAFWYKKEGKSLLSVTD